MPTYQLFAVPMPGYDPDPRTCPLMPQEVMMDSLHDAIDFAEGIVAESAYHFRERLWERAREAANPDADAEPRLEFEFDAKAVADEVKALIDQWRLVDRPTVNLMAGWGIDPVIRNGHCVQMDFSQVADEEKVETFDVLIDGIVAGYLHREPDEISGRPAWRIGKATGLLAALADRRWNDYSADYPGRTERWLAGVVLTDIRTALLGRHHPVDRRVASLTGE